MTVLELLMLLPVITRYINVYALNMCDIGHQSLDGVMIYVATKYNPLKYPAHTHVAETTGCMYRSQSTQ